MNPKNICFNSFLNILHKCVRHIHSHAMLHSCCFFFFYWFIFFLSCRSRLVFCMVEQALRVNAPICALYACVHIYICLCVWMSVSVSHAAIASVFVYSQACRFCHCLRVYAPCVWVRVWFEYIVGKSELAAVKSSQIWKSLRSSRASIAIEINSTYMPMWRTSRRFCLCVSCEHFSFILQTHIRRGAEFKTSPPTRHYLSTARWIVVLLIRLPTVWNIRQFAFNWRYSRNV